MRPYVPETRNRRERPKPAEFTDVDDVEGTVCREGSVGGGPANRADSLSVTVTETFFRVDVEDIQQATGFYARAPR